MLGPEAPASSESSGLPPENGKWRQRSLRCGWHPPFFNAVRKLLSHDDLRTAEITHVNRGSRGHWAQLLSDMLTHSPSIISLNLSGELTVSMLA